MHPLIHFFQDFVIQLLNQLVSLLLLQFLKQFVSLLVASIFEFQTSFGSGIFLLVVFSCMKLTSTDNFYCYLDCICYPAFLLESSVDYDKTDNNKIMEDIILKPLILAHKEIV